MSEWSGRLPCTSSKPRSGCSGRAEGREDAFSLLSWTGNYYASPTTCFIKAGMSGNLSLKFDLVGHGTTDEPQPRDCSSRKRQNWHNLAAVHRNPINLCLGAFTTPMTNGRLEIYLFFNKFLYPFCWQDQLLIVNTDQVLGRLLLYRV